MNKCVCAEPVQLNESKHWQYFRQTILATSWRRISRQTDRPCFFSSPWSKLRASLHTKVRWPPPPPLLALSSQLLLCFSAASHRLVWAKEAVAGETLSGGVPTCRIPVVGLQRPSIEASTQALQPQTIHQIKNSAWLKLRRFLTQISVLQGIWSIY